MNKNPLKTSMKNGLIITSLLTVLAGSIGVFWYWAGTVQGRLQEVVSGSYNNTDNAQQDRLYIMRQELRSSSRGVSTLIGMSITEQQVPQLLNQLETLGGDSTKVHIKSVNISSDGFISVSVAFSSSFDSTMELIEGATNIPYAFSVDSLDMRIGDPAESGDSDTWDVSMRITIPLVGLEIK